MCLINWLKTAITRIPRDRSTLRFPACAHQSAHLILPMKNFVFVIVRGFVFVFARLPYFLHECWHHMWCLSTRLLPIYLLPSTVTRPQTFTNYIETICLWGKRTSLMINWSKQVSSILTSCLWQLLLCFKCHSFKLATCKIRPRRWSIFQSDGMVNVFFQATIDVNGFSMVLATLDHHH